MRRNIQRQAGFTIIELVMVIVILGIVAVMASGFITGTTRNAFASAERQQIQAINHTISVQLSRGLRAALPNSIRITADKQCIEYIPILAGSVYTELNVYQPINRFNIMPPSRNVSGYIAVYPLSVANPYAVSNTGPITAEAISLTTNSTEVVLTTAQTFASHSPRRRYFIVGQPVAFCQRGTYLYEYRNYGFIPNVSNLTASLPTNSAGGRAVVAYPMDSSSPIQFEYLPATLKRNALVRFEYGLTLAIDDAKQRYGQEVFVRNVP